MLFIYFTTAQQPDSSESARGVKMEIEKRCFSWQWKHHPQILCIHRYLQMFTRPWLLPFVKSYQNDGYFWLCKFVTVLKIVTEVLVTITRSVCNNVHTYSAVHTCSCFIKSSIVDFYYKIGSRYICIVGSWYTLHYQTYYFMWLLLLSQWAINFIEPWLLAFLFC